MVLSERIVLSNFLANQIIYPASCELSPASENMQLFSPHGTEDWMGVSARRNHGQIFCDIFLSAFAIRSS